MMASQPDAFERFAQHRRDFRAAVRRGDFGLVFQRWSTRLPPPVAVGDADPCMARVAYNELVRDLANELGLDPEESGGGDVLAAVRAGACAHGVFMTKACPSCYRYPAPVPHRKGRTP